MLFFDEVYCISCLSSLDDEALKCQVCECLHPGDIPNVCLDLHHFLEEYFPAEYESRREKIQFEKRKCNHESSSSGKLRLPSSVNIFSLCNKLIWLTRKGGKVV
jgi:hypothetical protein